jgi:hypothetical protein
VLLVFGARSLGPPVASQDRGLGGLAARYKDTLTRSHDALENDSSPLALPLTSNALPLAWPANMDHIFSLQRSPR